jgi:hypothetical protein
MGCQQKMKIPDLRETYGYKDTHPFGGYVAYHIVEQSFPDNWMIKMTLLVKT